MSYAHISCDRHLAASRAVGRASERLLLHGFLLVAVVGVLSFHAGLYPPIVLSVAVFGAAGWYLLKAYRAQRAGPLVAWFFIAYTLPFIHLVPYLWFDFGGQTPQRMWGLTVNPYMVDKDTVELMALIGALGAVGFVVGQAVGQNNSRRRLSADAHAETLPQARSLSLSAFSLWIVISVFLSWLYAPPETIFEAKYTEGMAISQNWNFSSIWMISYIVLIWCVADELLDAHRERSCVKRAMVVAALVVIVVWLQLLRGDRESIPLAVASVFMFVRWQSRVAPAAAAQVRVWTRKPVVLGGALIVVLSYLVGALRSAVAGLDWGGAAEVLASMWAEGAIGLENIIHGTWSAVLLTPLSIAGDYLAGSLRLKLGEDYLNYLLSLPPGFVADFFGYERPIDAWHGPAWEMTYGIGGTHAVVVPFMNFRAIGVVLVLALWGYIVAYCERRTCVGTSVRKVALWGTLFMVAPHWFWYGDKYLINAVIIWWGIGLLYQLPVGRPGGVLRPPRTTASVGG